MRLLGQGGVCEGHVGQPQSEGRVWAGEHSCVTVFVRFCFSFPSILESCRGHVLTVCVSGDYWVMSEWPGMSLTALVSADPGRGLAVAGGQPALATHEQIDKGSIRSSQRNIGPMYFWREYGIRQFEGGLWDYTVSSWEWDPQL